MREGGNQIVANSGTEGPERSEPPDDSGGCSVVILHGAGVLGVHVIALQSPGEILEPQLVVHTASGVYDQWLIDGSAGVQVANAGHGMNKWSPFADIGGETRTAHGVVLGFAAAVEAAAVDYQPEAGQADEG